MTRKRIVVVGAGLGGCVVAHTLLEAGHQVTMVINQHDKMYPQDIGKTAITEPHVGTGYGGTTRYWHNGLRLPEDEVWGHWPLGRDELVDEIGWAYRKLGNQGIRELGASLRDAWARILVGDEVRLEEGLFYPGRRLNLWGHLRLAGRVGVVEGRCLPLKKTPRVREVEILGADGVVRPLPCDAVVLCAGGLGTPLILGEIGNPWVGKGYEDHPTGLVAEVELNMEGVQKLWNVPVAGGSLRQPLVVKTKCGLMAWYVRPSPPVGYGVRRARLGTLLSDIRNYPWRVGNYVRLLMNFGDLMEVVSLKLGWNVPTKRFGLWLVGGCPPSEHVAVGGNLRTGEWWRDWRLPEEYESCVRESLGGVVQALGDKVVRVTEVEGWFAGLQSSSHHSGTCRMAKSAKNGVVDAEGKVFGMGNVWVADGSIIPNSGTANTGVLIAALARRIAGKVGEA